jgi:Fur family zinc uptake transcriptional regulator
MQKNISNPALDSPSLCSAQGHQACIKQALTTASELCNRNGLRLTPTRKRVLELVWQSHQPLGAYEILAQLSAESERPAAPPTVYRALDFLLDNGLIHRLASLNAYIGCDRPHQAHQGHFLICRQCKIARELPHDNIDIAVEQAAAALGFHVEQQVVEVSGLCAPCREQA